MAGRIKAADIDEVKARTNIADIVGDYVTLKSAGVGSLKGLCPFHDERSPSFHVRPQVGYYHCFGCGESGDVYSFVQKMDHLSFTEAVERLAQRLGFELHYEEGGNNAQEGANRSRLYAANAAAANYFVSQLASAEAAPGRAFLGERGFDKAAAETFGIGYAPQGWNGLRDHLKTLGYTDEEMLSAGLLSQGDKGAYDRFRGRLVWPIRDLTSQVVGFGARKLYDDDQGPKYLNTPETPIYHKAQVLYGLDLAKREIGKTRQVVVVEGYTDVMAAYLSGVTTAVATCGTAFGADHIKVIRRVMGDDSGLGEVVFTFDGDAAGQKAALRAFGQEKSFAAQTFVAVAPEGLDPCDLRLKRGEAAVRDLIDSKTPMFEFVIKQMLTNYNLDTVEGRVAALREAAPVVADIRDASLKPGYTRELARLVGIDLAEAEQAVKKAASSPSSSASTTPAAPARTAASPTAPGSVRESAQDSSPSGEQDATEASPPLVRIPTLAELDRDPQLRLERDALMALLQFPAEASEELASAALNSAMKNESLALVRDALAAQLASRTAENWMEIVVSSMADDYRPFLTQLAVAPLPVPIGAEKAYVRGVLAALIERDLLRKKAELVGRLQRATGDAEASRVIQQELIELETQRRILRDER